MELVFESFQAVARHYPPLLQAEMAAGLPSLALEASRLALEVMQAERDGLPYAEAARRIDYPLMGRVHNVLRDLLQVRLPDYMRGAVRSLAAAAKQGEFDGLRRSIFNGADGNDLQAALLRFGIYESTRLDLLIATWEIPELEVVGALERIDREAQTTLRDLLTMPEMREGEVRPLNVLFAELAIRAFGDADALTRAMQSTEAIEMVLRLADATRTIRGLDAPNAAVARAELDEDEIGSQQLVDAYPWHFPTTNAVDQRRSRLRQAMSENKPPLVTDGSRFVDMVREAARKEEDR